MLARMGFKPGQGLGKAGDGRTEPVPIELKSGRGGLGLAAAATLRAEAATRGRAMGTARRERAAADAMGDFRLRKQREFAEKRVRGAGLGAAMGRPRPLLRPGRLRPMRWRCERRATRWTRRRRVLGCRERGAGGDGPG